MKHIPIDNNIYKFLKEIDNHYKDELIGLSCKNQISDEVISRIQKNNWNNNNTYVYVITEINKIKFAYFQFHKILLYIKEELLCVEL